MTGARAQRLVDELKAARVYAGDAPAGCQPTGHSTTIKVDSAGRQLSFRSYCDFIWAGDNAEMLWSPALVKAVDSTATSLRPTTVVVPPPTGTLQVGPITVYDKGSHLDRGVTGVVTVTQDGKRLASKRLGTGGRLSVKVVPGAYSVTGTSAGLRCQTMEVTVVPGEEVGGGPYCSKS